MSVKVLTGHTIAAVTSHERRSVRSRVACYGLIESIVRLRIPHKRRHSAVLHHSVLARLLCSKHLQRVCWATGGGVLQVAVASPTIGSVHTLNHHRLNSILDYLVLLHGWSMI